MLSSQLPFKEYLTGLVEPWCDKFDVEVDSGKLYESEFKTAHSSPEEVTQAELQEFASNRRC